MLPRGPYLPAPVCAGARRCGLVHVGYSTAAVRPTWHPNAPASVHTTATPVAWCGLTPA